MKYLTMTPKEINRFNIITKLLDKEINGTYAAELLKLSVRQVKRIKVRVKKHGPKALIHGNRYKQGNRAMPDQERKTIARLIKKHYSDFKPRFASEKLEKNHSIKRDPKTIRKVMIEEDLWKPRKKKRKEYHCWRERKASLGEMLQFDGSYHAWFEGRGPRCCLLAAIDDATGIPIKAQFNIDEGVFPVFTFWKEYVEKHGKPLSIYLDKFSTYRMNQKVAIENHETKTQFQRAMNQLDIEPITAHSAEAKGRIERLFNTLQDRLIKEMRLRNISTMEAANKFLEEEFLQDYKAKFAVEPRSNINLHRTLNPEERRQLSSIFSKQSTRTVRNDFTISYNNQWHQLLEEQPVTIRKQDKIIVEEWLNGSVNLSLRGRYLNSKIITERPKKRKEIAWVIAAKKHTHHPPINHPWRENSILKV